MNEPAKPILSCPLRFLPPREAPVRRGEPVTVGLPWPRGAVTDDRQFRLIGPAGNEEVLQTQVLDRWPDGSVRWCLFDFRATVGVGGGYAIEVTAARVSKTVPTDVCPTTTCREQELYFRGGDVPPTVDGLATVELKPVHSPPFQIPFTDRLAESGPIRCRAEIRWVSRKPRGHVAASVTGQIDFFPWNSTTRVHLSVRNHRAADHPGGNWDLGNEGYADIEFLACHFRPIKWPESGHVRTSSRIGSTWSEPTTVASLDQRSSGGPNWRSVTHYDRKRNVDLPVKGFRLSADGVIAEGDRATPIVTLESDDKYLGATMPHFWENFPKSITADKDGITLHLFPKEAGPHELQGGEQKTHTFYVAFGKDTITDEPMAWCRSPLVCHADPEWYAAAGVIPYFTPKAADPNAEYLKLVDQAIEGPDTFFDKREKIDEYGWRHFGDVWGDHEAVKTNGAPANLSTSPSHQSPSGSLPPCGGGLGWGEASTPHPNPPPQGGREQNQAEKTTGFNGPEPMVSHYNNQYDCVAGFLYQFLRNPDPRWWDLAIPCADHTCDIDVYHTDGDKAAYNRGLFWHTYHYAPADTGTHRSYPKSLRKGPQGSLTEKMDQLGETAEKLKKSYAVGGGPAASHNYNHGLMLAYFLTGNPLYKETAVDLAQFVINMEDPSKTPFRFLSREYTGLATESGGGGYHGPGRASANSVNALLVGHQLTGDKKYLDKAEQIIRRVSHPKQNLESFDLLNAELRWFYTMFLQSLGRYLDYKIELGQLDEMYGYGRLTLLHYARWMATHERPILDAPEKLQYPTETWAAQDMRKVEVFQFAAKHAVGEEKERFLERAEWFFRYVEKKLHEFPTKSLCRPVVLMLNFGWSRAWWMTHPDASAPPPEVVVSENQFGEWRMFVPQKVKAIKRAKMLATAGFAFGCVLLAGLIWWMVK